MNISFQLKEQIYNILNNIYLFTRKFVTYCCLLSDDEKMMQIENLNREILIINDYLD